LSSLVIIGMNNPHSTSKRMSLAPYPSRVAGHRLWSMLNSVRKTPRAEYMRLTNRINLLNEYEWCPIRAKKASIGLWDSLQDSRVLVLGQPTRNVLALPERPPLLWTVSRGVRWCSVPHPSGLNRWYNDPVNCAAVGYRLAKEICFVDKNTVFH